RCRVAQPRDAAPTLPVGLTHFHPQAHHPPALRVFGVPVSRSMESQLIDAMPGLQPQARGPVATDEYAMRKSRVHRAVPVDVETG
ncbi:hypothetical protein, partial [Streptomyces sp. Ncost-T10-10d]|uniref:hypothetical protein n=1 Tax=Streptomyces sp. Ncost-T10-10d TaxID=1839774 RepID=UPI00081EDEE2